MVGSMMVDMVRILSSNLILVISPAALKIQSFPAMRALHESREPLSWLPVGAMGLLATVTTIMIPRHAPHYPRRCKLNLFIPIVWRVEVFP